jgi:hypothetical protein
MLPCRALLPRLLPIVCIVGVCAALCAGAAMCAAQSPSTDVSDSPPQPAQFHSGLTEINENWLEHDGDNSAWAARDLNESGWQAVDDIEDMGPATVGWKWFRKRVVLQPGHGHLHLLIAGGAGTYELFIDGEKQPGPRLQTELTVRRPLERVIPVPGDANEITLALRTHSPRVYTTWHLPLFLTVALGTPDAIENDRQAMQSQRLYQALPSIAIDLILMLAAIGAFALYGSQRDHLEYPWLGLYLLLLGISNLLMGCVETGLAPVALNNVAADPMVYLLTIAQIEFTFRFAGKRVSRPWRAYEAFLVAPLVLNGLVWIGRIPSTEYLLVEASVILPAAILLPVFLLLWYRRGNREAGWLILPSLLPLATASLFDLGTVSIYMGWGFADFLDNPIMLGPVPLQLSDLGDFLFLLAIGVVMFFRFTRVSREQARAAAELEAAREIQRQLVPASLPPVAGWRVEAAYFPAQEVGGDFYQVLEQADGSTLIALGDVSGKGLKAAMTGALAIGALRTLAAEDLRPAELLERLNRQMLEAQDGGFVTCVAARVSPDGELTVANAGHLSPYRNGLELACEPGLPLGIHGEAAYAEAIIQIDPGDRLTFLSDGVVEARGPGGELLGFERTRELSTRAAAEIAEAAQRFGQEDDITVMTLEFAAANSRMTSAEL